MTTVLRVTDDTTRLDLEIALGHLTRSAKREQYVVARFADDPPTPWDVAHQRIDAVLTDWRAAATCKTCELSRARCETSSGCCAQCRHE